MLRVVVVLAGLAYHVSRNGWRDDRKRGAAICGRKAL